AQDAVTVPLHETLHGSPPDAALAKHIILGTALERSSFLRARGSPPPLVAAVAALGPLCLRGRFPAGFTLNGGTTGRDPAAERIVPALFASFAITTAIGSPTDPGMQDDRWFRGDTLRRSSRRFRAWRQSFV